MVKIFEKLPAGMPLKFEDIVQAENKILKAIKHSSLREWLTTVGCHHNESYRHCLFVTGFAVAFAQHLGMREDDQRRLARAALLHDVGKAFIPVAILDKPDELTRKRNRRSCASIRAAAMTRSRRRAVFRRKCSTSCCTTTNSSTAPAIRTACPASQISDIVRLTTIVDIYAALVENRAYRIALSPALKAFSIMEEMGDKLDQQLLQAFRPVASGLGWMRHSERAKHRPESHSALRLRCPE